MEATIHMHKNHTTYNSESTTLDRNREEIENESERRRESG